MIERGYRYPVGGQLEPTEIYSCADCGFKFMDRLQSAIAFRKLKENATENVQGRTGGPGHRFVERP